MLGLHPANSSRVPHPARRAGQFVFNQLRCAARRQARHKALEWKKRVFLLTEFKNMLLCSSVSLLVILLHFKNFNDIFLNSINKNLPFFVLILMCVHAYVEYVCERFICSVIFSFTAVLQKTCKNKRHQMARRT